MLINYTNHPSVSWSADQLTAAGKYGEILDIPFPAVSPSATAEEISRLAATETTRILQHHPDAVLCQGEFTLCYNIINELRRRHIPTLAACSERLTITEPGTDGYSHRDSIFKFVQFREYK